MVGLLLITHGEIGQELLKTASAILNKAPTNTEAICIEDYPSREAVSQYAKKAIQNLNSGSGVLVLTDLYGATPHNITNTLNELPICTVSGLNLSMLLKTINYIDLPLNELALKASEGGHIGITCNTCNISDKER